ncbi:MAG: hypothetical protein HQL24_10335 [Candidatus Omnitrophica bacterium]|nr:hypothetical protein [Candidatus Omnitrophota bacterium]
MALNNKFALLITCLTSILFFNGCGFVNLNNESLEEYGNKVMVTMATLVTYIGKNKDDVRKTFREPTEIKHESGLIHTHYKEDKVPFNEIWYYIYRRGISGITAEGSTKRFFFNDQTVVSVDAF